MGELKHRVGKSLGWWIPLAIAAAGAGYWLVWQTRSPRPTVAEKPAGSSLSAVTLTEFDDRGKLLWRVKARQAEYDQQKRKAQIVEVSGTFYRDGKPIVEATGRAGWVDQARQEIAIEGDVRAIALEDKVTLAADRMVWQPETDLLAATGSIKIQQPEEKITITGKTVRANPAARRYSIQTDVVVTTADPPLKLEGPILTWDVARDRAIGEAPFRIVHLKQDYRLRADRGEWMVKKQQVLLTGNVRARAPKQNLEATSAAMQWDIKTQFVRIPSPLRVTSDRRGITVEAGDGSIDLAKQVITLTGQVEATSRQDNARLTASRAEWQIPQQIVTARGNVRYKQAKQDLSVAGTEAIANLATQTVRVTGGDVVTSISP